MANEEEVLMPLMGEGVNEATVIKWLKNPGEQVEQGEPLVQVSTDKVDTEIVAPHGGYFITSFAKEDETIYVDQVIAQISADASAEKITPPPVKVPAKSTAVKPQESGPPAPGERRHVASTSVLNAGVGVSPVPVSQAGIVRTSPIVRKMAREQNIDLRLVQGTGAMGRITKADLLDFIANGGASRIVSTPVTTAVEKLAEVDDLIFKVETKTNEKGQETLEGVVVKREKMSKIRRLTAQHMVRSVRTSPHVTTTFAIDLHRIVESKNRLSDTFKSDYDLKLTYTPFFLEAAVAALKEHPIANASVDGDDILYKEDINLGCAVAIDSGLIVPVIKKAQNLDLRGLAEGLNDLVVRARASKLNPSDMQGGTFSITNPGMFGCLHSSPIINQPQVAIMSIGAIVQQPTVIQGDITIRPICHIGLTFDHRIIDGEDGTKFLATLKNFLENYEIP